MSVGERERATLARVVETFVPGAPANAVANRIVAELEAVGRPKLNMGLKRERSSIWSSWRRSSRLCGPERI